MPDTKPPWDERTTLLRPPPPDPNKAPIENVLEVTELAILGPVRTRGPCRAAQPRYDAQPQLKRIALPAY